MFRKPGERCVVDFTAKQETIDQHVDVLVHTVQEGRRISSTVSPIMNNGVLVSK